MLNNLFSELSFLFIRLDWLSVLDLLLVSAIFFVVLSLVRGTQAVVLLRGMIFLVIVIGLLSGLLPLPAFSYLLKSTLPALLIAIPVIFAPEIRRALERLGRAGNLFSVTTQADKVQRTVEAIGTATQRLASHNFGALVIIEREVPLEEYLETGVTLDAFLTPELLLQVFHVNTPLHDGAVIIRGDRVAAAACVMPLSASGTLTRSPERQMGLRHRAALGISEVSDAVAVVVSEETGAISVAHNGRMIRRLDQTRLRNILLAFYHPRAVRLFPAWFERLMVRLNRTSARAPGS
jgi:diadenylate cyclase